MALDSRMLIIVTSLGRFSFYHASCCEGVWQLGTVFSGFGL